jgi:metal-sulfur cluster biosynthetic enzyme
MLINNAAFTVFTCLIGNVFAGAPNEDVTVVVTTTLTKTYCPTTNLFDYAATTPLEHGQAGVAAIPGHS